MKNGYLLTFCAALLQLLTIEAASQTSTRASDEIYRPKIHFSPKAHWINDPNGMVYYKGIYHLFFQYHPYSSVWGPMHWGHATSADMINWTERPIAIYPDSIGTIFSGSAVVDANNTSGFGKAGSPPLVAIFTQHSTEGEKAGKDNFQNQSIAYSNDDGKTWTKYAGNPVVKNPGFKDFRDPKVMWHEPTKKWIMTLAVKDHVSFYSSPDLKTWAKESDFGADRGAHGGGWECPDLFPMNDNGKQRWVLIVNLNPGAPNGGSGTQYFIGDFDGKNFTSEQKETKWIDYGPDNYAGITWSNTGDRKTFLGWMSNWTYANKVPTETWRNAMTLPRDLRFQQVGNELLITSQPVSELLKNNVKPVAVQNIAAGKTDLVKTLGAPKFPCRINLESGKADGFSIRLSNDSGEELLIGYDENKRQYFIDRTKAGKSDFQKDFAARLTAPRIGTTEATNVSLVFDASSVELFADDGLSVMTALFFPTKPYTQLTLQSAGVVKRLEYAALKPMNP